MLLLLTGMIEWMEKGKIQTERVPKSLRCQVMLNQDDVEMFVSFLSVCIPYCYFITISITFSNQ